MIDSCLQSFYDGIAVKPINHIDDYADKFVYLKPGVKVDISRVPFVRRIMKAMSYDSPMKLGVCIKGVQLTITTTALICISEIIEEMPCNIIYVMPTGSGAEDVSKFKFMPIVEATPTLRNLIADTSVRDGKNTITSKSYKGGTLWFIGANSSAEARSKDAMYIFIDEYSEMARELKAQGSHIKTYKGRMASYGDRAKMFVFSTPVEMENDKTYPEFLQGSQEYYYVPCPFCLFKQVIKWENLIIVEKNVASSIRLKCINPDCNKYIEEKHKPWMFDEANGAEWISHNPVRRNMDCLSWHLPSMYSPLGFLSWREMAQDWFEAQDDVAKLKTFSLLYLAEPWLDKEDEETKLEELMNRRRKYSAQIEPGVLLITAGVDTQGDRLEVYIWGHGLNGQMWLIEYEILRPPEGRRNDHPLAWEQLETVRRRTYMHPCGVEMPIAAMAVDTGGGYENQAYKFVKGKHGQRCFAIKGSSQHGKPLLVKPTISNKGNVMLYVFGTDTAKRTLFGRLRAKKQSEQGYINLPDFIDDEVCRQILSEKLKLVRERSKRGDFVNTKVYKKIRDRNEALDCLVYAYFACENIRPNWVSLAETYKMTDSKNNETIIETVKVENNIDNKEKIDSETDEEITFDLGEEENGKTENEPEPITTEPEPERKSIFSRRPQEQVYRPRRPPRSTGFTNNWR